jgi:small subunit ribosomal protein S6
MTKYEALYVLDVAAGQDEALAKESIEKFSSVVTANGGTVDSIDEWGKRKLAYPIDYKTEGYYVLMRFSAEPEFPKELERNFKIADEIIRYLVTKLDD